MFQRQGHANIIRERYGYCIRDGGGPASEELSDAFEAGWDNASSQCRLVSSYPTLNHVVQTYVVPVAAAQDRNIPRTLDGEERMRSEYHKRTQLQKLRQLVSPPDPSWRWWEDPQVE